VGNLYTNFLLPKFKRTLMYTNFASKSCANFSAHLKFLFWKLKIHKLQKLGIQKVKLTFHAWYICMHACMVRAVHNVITINYATRKNDFEALSSSIQLEVVYVCKSGGLIARTLLFSVTCYFQSLYSVKNSARS